MRRKSGLAFVASMFLTWSGSGLLADAIPGGTLDPTTIDKYQLPLIIPPAMPRTGKIKVKGNKNVDYYEIAVRQFQQRILPPGLPMTTVWSYGSLEAPGTVAEGGSFNYPAFTIEAKWKKPIRVRWINDLVDPVTGDFLLHLLPVDQTLHWANPNGLAPDTRGTSQDPYLGPVPMITHVHGAHTNEESDGYPEAWYLPAAGNIPDSINSTAGTFYDEFKGKFESRFPGDPLAGWDRGTAVFQYPNDQRATTLWYHDHTLGMTRLNVYAGPAGFYLLRGGPDDEVFDDTSGEPAALPGPAPALGDPPGLNYYEIPIVIQDRSFDDDGSLYYPDNRAFFEGLDPEQLQIDFIPDSDVSPIWNPEFFGNTIVVNGRTWPFLQVEQRRYRFRYLNGSNSRFLILRHDNGLPFYQIGAEGGFLPGPVELEELLMAPAERADVIVDFTDVPEGTLITLLNLGPDEPFGGGEPGVDFDPSDPETTGQVMQFRVVAAAGADPSTEPQDLVLPAIVPLGPEDNTRKLSLNEEESQVVCVVEDDDGNLVQVDCADPGAEIFGPTSALLGTVDDAGNGVPLLWSDEVTENPAVGATEVWEIYNFTADAHPIHIHLVQFQVVDRQGLVSDEEGVAVQPAELVPDTTRPPESWETGFKDTVIAFPGEVTRVKAKFDVAGLFVWHCHIVEHEDNEMMRPYRIGPAPGN